MIDLIAIENHLPALQVVIPLLLAPVAILVSLPFLSWLVALFGSLFCLYASVSLFFQVSEFGKINYFMGGWLPPYGIEYVIDEASSFMIVLISLMGVFATIFAYQSLIKEINEKSQSKVYGMWLLALGGLLGLVTTGDAFNLFVFLEISSLSSVTLVALGSKKDTDNAVKAAKTAFETWKETSKKERLELLEKLLIVYKKRFGEMAEAISLEMGAPMDWATDVQTGSGQTHLEDFILRLKDFEFDEHFDQKSNNHIYYEPIGICGLITPWNWPINQIALKVVPAFATGLGFAPIPAALLGLK